MKIQQHFDRNPSVFALCKELDGVVPNAAAEKVNVVEAAINFSTLVACSSTEEFSFVMTFGPRPMPCLLLILHQGTNFCF